ncbi:hypothetical protein Tco_0810659 [Tanacetum coccineum]
MVRSMMIKQLFLSPIWDYALETAARNSIWFQLRRFKRAPYEYGNGKAPKLSYLKVWGCEALVKQDTLTKPNKLEPSESLEDLEIIQEEDTHPSIDTSLNHEEDDLEIDEPQSDIIPFFMSTVHDVPQIAKAILKPHRIDYEEPSLQLQTLELLVIL